MVVPKSPEKKLRQNLCSEAHIRPNPSLSQNSGGLEHLSSNGNFSPDASLELRPQEFSETDALLPNELYGGSRFSRCLRGKGPEGSSGPEETVCSMVLQILIPFLLAGFGTVSAGMLLDVVQVRKQARAESTKSPNVTDLTSHTHTVYHKYNIMFHLKCLHPALGGLFASLRSLCFCGRAGTFSRTSQRSSFWFLLF